MAYAWIIDRDHLAEAELRNGGKAEDNAKGTIGPRDAPDWACDVLQRAGGHNAALAALRANGATVRRFKMYDDDGELYYTGRLISDDVYDDAGRPLDDYGTPNAGAVSIRYAGHPELDCY